MSSTWTASDVGVTVTVVAVVIVAVEGIVLSTCSTTGGRGPPVGSGAMVLSIVIRCLFRVVCGMY